MQLTIKKQIGKNVVTFICEGKNLHEATLQSEHLAFDDVPACGICESTDLRLTARIAGEEKYKYTEIRCLSCRASLTFGQRKDNPDLFYLRKKEDGSLDWKAYEKPQ